MSPVRLPHAFVFDFFQNVLIGDDDRAKIADFGVSQYFKDEELRTPKSARSLARSALGSLPDFW